MASTHPAHRDLHSQRRCLPALCLTDPAIKPPLCSPAGLGIRQYFPSRTRGGSCCRKSTSCSSDAVPGAIGAAVLQLHPTGAPHPRARSRSRTRCSLRFPSSSGYSTTSRHLGDEEALPMGAGAGIGHPGTTTRCPTRRGPAGGAAPARGAAGTAPLSSRLHFIPAHSPFAKRPREPPAEPGRHGGSFRRRRG